MLHVPSRSEQVREGLEGHSEAMIFQYCLRFVRIRDGDQSSPNAQNVDAGGIDDPLLPQVLRGFSKENSLFIASHHPVTELRYCQTG
jgi:hypothetical protein